MVLRRHCAATAARRPGCVGLARTATTRKAGPLRFAVAARATAHRTAGVAPFACGDQSLAVSRWSPPRTAPPLGLVPPAALQPPPPPCRPPRDAVARFGPAPPRGVPRPPPPLDAVPPISRAPPPISAPDPHSRAALSLGAIQPFAGLAAQIDAHTPENDEPSDGLNGSASTGERRAHSGFGAPHRCSVGAATSSHAGPTFDGRESTGRQ
jgi:hypothetical protein